MRAQVRVVLLLSNFWVFFFFFVVFFLFLAVCAVVVQRCVSGVVFDVHGIGPTCLLLLLCVVCPGVLRDRERERARAISRQWGQATRESRWPCRVESIRRVVFEPSPASRVPFEVEVRLAGQKKRQSA